MEVLRLALDNSDEARLMQPAVLAFMGDAVFNLFIRERLILRKMGTSHQLHLISTQYVKASSQASIVKQLFQSFTEEEAYIFRRGRNAKSTTVPKNADIQDYKYATAFEAVLGFLYLTGQQERLNDLMLKAAHIIEKPEMEIQHEKE
ncbi:MAG: Mini-ribonuclease 3 [Clostridia bacterium]|nr:Mini-ribonuclease 3 [Clostridia bacterium]